MAEYTLTRQIETLTMRGISTHYANYHIFKTEKGFPDKWNLMVPCRSRLNHLLTGIFYNFEWDSTEVIKISEEDYMILKHIFANQTEYKLWKKTMEKIASEGIEEAKNWLLEQAKVLAVRNLLKGKRV